MPDTPNTFFLTTPIYYVNARPHIGHAYTTLAADTIARRHRLLGDDTFFLTGTDEHGQKIERSAAAAGIPPQQFTDEVSASFQDLWKRMGITNDAFIRTTSDAHKRGAQKLFADLHARGQIYLSSYTGQYSVGEEMFVEGPPGTLGPDGKPTETVTEENFFFRLSDYQLRLLDLIESDTLLIQPPERKNEVLSFLRGSLWQEPSRRPHLSELQADGTRVTNDEARKRHIQAAIDEGELKLTALRTPYVPGALRDLSVSRSSFTWGIPVPEPAASETKQPHVIYVWLDALANYMTALGYGSDDPALWEKFWPADLHLVGKEIIRFHCVYWPAFLLAANLPLPKAVTAHGWLLFDDSKMSKSKGNIVRTETILDAFGTLCPPVPIPSPAPLLSSRSEAEGSASPTSRPPTKSEQDLFAADVLRYFLLREIPFGQDGSFSFDAMWNRYNSELTNGYGNLVSRILKMVADYYDGSLPDMPETHPINRSIFPEWWISDPLAIDAIFNDWRPELSQAVGNLVQIRDKNKQVGMALDINANITAGRFFYDESVVLSIREFLQASIDPLLRAHNTQAASVHPSRFLQTVADQIQTVDGILSLTRPWQLSQQPRQRLDIIQVVFEAVRIFTAALYPFLPHATAKVWHQLGLGDVELAAKNGELTNLQWGGLKPGTQLGPLSPIFPRADKGLAQIMIDMEASKSAPAKEQSVSSASSVLSLSPDEQDTSHPGAAPRTATLPDPAPGTTVAGSNALTTERPIPASQTNNQQLTTTTPPIAIDDFTKVDLRVAQIVVAERIPKADKLLRLEVDLGYERRQILSGIAEWYTPEELLGRRIVIIANLAPRKMRGLESHGMLLAASSGDTTKPILTTFGEEIALGSRVR